MKNIDEVREIFKNDRFATTNGMYIEEIGLDYAKCSLEISENHKNALGALMGGVSFTLADFAFAVAANLNGNITVSLSSSITYLSQPKGKKLYAEAKCEKDGKTTCYYAIRIFDELDTQVAHIVTNGFHINKG